MTNIPQESIDAINGGRYLLGVTGVMGSGKSYVCRSLVEVADQHSLKTCYIDVDTVRRSILGPSPGYTIVRDAIAKAFGPAVQLADTSIDRAALGSITFDRKDALATYNSIMLPHIHANLEAKIFISAGLVLLEWACLTEDKMMNLVDYNVLLVTCIPEEQMRRLSEGDLPKDQIKRRIASQWTEHKKRMHIQDIQERVCKGFYLDWDTTDNPPLESYSILLGRIIRQMTKRSQ